jgi:hypothetical protein
MQARLYGYIDPWVVLLPSWDGIAQELARKGS